MACWISEREAEKLPDERQGLVEKGLSSDPGEQKQTKNGPNKPKAVCSTCKYSEDYN